MKAKQVIQNLSEKYWRPVIIIAMVSWVIFIAVTSTWIEFIANVAVIVLGFIMGRLLS
jgi:hypothetical protein